MQTLDIISVNTSLQKGTVKEPVKSITLTNLGIDGDAHAGNWNRQVSLLGVESIKKMEPAAGRVLKWGEFAENLTTKGYELFKMKPLDRLIGGEIVLEVTQIGKKCHGEKCTIFRQTGNCVMPSEGIFCRVISGGTLKAGDQLQYVPKVYKTAIITLSERAHRGEYEDKSGPAIEEILQKYFKELNITGAFEKAILPDDPVQLKQMVTSLAGKTDFIFTTGGTGIGPRDISPDVIRPLLDKEILGIMEYIRVKYGMEHPNALISRSIAGTMDSTLVYVLPGNPKAAREYTLEIVRTLEHSLYMIHAIDNHG